MASLDRQLEVLCITYNRARDLQRTLEQLADGPVAGCRITVLDNASPDDTPAVCAAFADRLPRLRVIRHPKNLGASANYLRAVELSRAPYTWVICDDDGYDFARFEDVEAAVCDGEVDLVSLGSAGGGVGWARGKSTVTTELRHEHPGFHFVSSFVPSLIFRTEIFDSPALAAGYRAAGTLFPHFPFLTACVTHPRSIYIAREQVLSRNDGQNVLSPLRFLSLWVNSCRTIEDAALRREVVFEPFDLGRAGHRWRVVRHVAEWIAYERLEHPERVVSELAEISLGLAPDQRRLLAPLIPLALSPRPVLRALREHRNGRRAPAPSAFAEAADALRL